jgi:hypothetical protein
MTCQDVKRLENKIDDLQSRINYVYHSLDLLQSNKDNSYLNEKHTIYYIDDDVKDILSNIENNVCALCSNCKHNNKGYCNNGKVCDRI